MLEYDNSAFYYFAMTLMCMYLLPGTWYTLSEVWKAFFSTGDADGEARCEAEMAKMDKIKAETTGLARLSKRGFLINAACLLATWAVFAYFMYQVMGDSGQVQQYDPYTILGVEHGATASEIKKAYRRLSLKFHPDKNIGNKEAEEMFKKIAKAHEALTDEQSKENYEKYGNPDGRQQSLEVSIGLPKILLENPKVVLVLYLIGMVIVIPAAVGYWYSQSKEFGEKNIYYDTYRTWLRYLKGADQKMKNLPEIFAASAECRKIHLASRAKSSGGAAGAAADAEGKDWLQPLLREDIRELVPKPAINDAATMRGNILLHMHLNRRTGSKDMDAAHREDLEQMLAKAPELLGGMIEMAWQQRFLETTRTLIRFQQNVVQGLWVKSSPLQQLPQLNEAEIKAVEEKGTTKESALRDFLALPSDAERRKILKSAGRFNKDDDPVLVDALKTARLLPDLAITLDHYVEEEAEASNAFDLVDDEERAKYIAAAANATAGVSGKKVHEQDLVTLKVTMRRRNGVGVGSTPAKGKAHKVLAPVFPRQLREAWWLILIGDVEGTPAIHAIERVTDQAEVVEHKLRFMCAYSASPTPYEMTLLVLSDCYCGLDQEHSFSYTVHSSAELPEYKAHEEDQALDNEPTLFEQVMAGQTVDYDSSDEEDKGEGEGAGGGGGAGAKGGAGGDGSDSDED